MRNLQSCILRLMIDESAPGELHGRLSPIGGGEESLFRDEEALLRALRQLQRNALEKMNEAEEEQ